MARRYRQLRLLLVALACIAAIPAYAAPTGRALAGLEPFDAAMEELLRDWEIPGGALAVAKDGRLLLARGYGLADRGRNEPVQPTSKFRLGSLSKTITAVAVLKLVEDGKLKLDDKVLPLLGETGPRPNAIRDAHVHDITVRHLLQHSAGFDRDQSGDPAFAPRAVEAAKRQAGAMPPTCETVLRDVLESKLDFAPGSRHSYSNVGYCILGRVIERVSGMSYEAFVRLRILAPSGASRLALGRTLEVAPDEVTYYDFPGAPLLPFMPGLGPTNIKVNAPYGAYSIEAMDAYGAWIGAPHDFLRFMLAIDGRRRPSLLSEDSFREMHTRPNYPGAEAGPVFYGLGINVRPVTGGRNWWHDGSQSGAKALALRTQAGYAWVATFNMHPRDRSAFFMALDRGLWAAARKIHNWPDGDLFPDLP
jgi:CubicO group peptidase (beta-lactamase class C family)